ncbi:hypothetical protein [Saccharothrix xinjiangensis]|uniref:Uncharacterized protein n=1 Tax=Saccharothrix xinjiangensis TaxID=204798 RepID=A0ABV9Y927_9PSEU
MNRMGRKLAALVGAVVLVLAGTGIAQASSRSFPEGFEWNPAGSWGVWVLGSGNGGFDYDNGTARSGRGNGWLHSGYRDSAAAAMGIWVPTGDSGRSDCVAHIYANPLNDRSREITVELFNSAGARIHHGERALTYPGYQPVALEFSLVGFHSVYVRYLLQDSGRGHDGEWVRLDDFQLTCWW